MSLCIAKRLCHRGFVNRPVRPRLSLWVRTSGGPRRKLTGLGWKIALKITEKSALVNTSGETLPQRLARRARKAEVEDPLGRDRLRRLDALGGGGDHLPLQFFLHHA